MRASSIFRAVLTLLALVAECYPFAAVSAVAQDVGADVGGGAGIFRPKNPEIKKAHCPAPTPVRRGTTNDHRRQLRTSTTGSKICWKREINFAMHAVLPKRKTAYQSIFKLKANDGRAAYGLGNIYSDQQRWEEAEAAYRNAATVEPDGCRCAGRVERGAGAAADRRRQCQAFCRCRKLCAAGDATRSRKTRLPGTVWESRCRRVVYSTTKPRMPTGAPWNSIRSLPVAYAHLARVLNRMGRTTEAAPLYEQGDAARERSGDAEFDCGVAAGRTAVAKL